MSAADIRGKMRRAENAIEDYEYSRTRGECKESAERLVRELEGAIVLAKKLAEGD